MLYKVEREAVSRRVGWPVLKHCLNKMDGLELAILGIRPGIIFSKLEVLLISAYSSSSLWISRDITLLCNTRGKKKKKCFKRGRGKKRRKPMKYYLRTTPLPVMTLTHWCQWKSFVIFFQVCSCFWYWTMELAQWLYTTLLKLPRVLRIVFFFLRTHDLELGPKCFTG